VSSDSVKTYLHAVSFYSVDEVFICKDCNRLNSIVTRIVLKITEITLKSAELL
jgi:hypothetical protein